MLIAMNSTVLAIVPLVLVVMTVLNLCVVLWQKERIAALGKEKLASVRMGGVVSTAIYVKQMQPVGP